MFFPSKINEPFILAESKNRTVEHHSVKVPLSCDFDGYLFVKNQFLRMPVPSKTRVTGFLTDIPGHFIFKRRFSFLLFPSKINEPFILTESKNRSAELYSVKITSSCDFDGYFISQNQFLCLPSPSKSREIGFLTDIPGHFIFKRRFSFLLFPSKMIKPEILTESKNRTVEHHSVKVPLS